jgi:hypothetical protein
MKNCGLICGRRNEASSHIVKPYQPPWGFSPEGKAVGGKSGSSEIKNKWSYISSIPYAFMASAGKTSLNCRLWFIQLRYQ